MKNLQKNLQKIVDAIECERAAWKTRRRTAAVFQELNSVGHRRKPHLRGLIVKSQWSPATAWRYHVVWSDGGISCCSEFSLFSAPLA
jgi:hypothetical protein